MGDWRLGTVEARFANIIWEHEPLTSAELIQLAEKELNWKRTTMYTVLKRLCDRGIFQNQKGTVSSLISREKFYALQSKEFVEESFGGSLPAFLTAFAAGKKLSETEIDLLQKLIDQSRG